MKRTLGWYKNINTWDFEIFSIFIFQTCDFFQCAFLFSYFRTDFTGTKLGLIEPFQFNTYHRADALNGSIVIELVFLVTSKYILGKTQIRWALLYEPVSLPACDTCTDLMCGSLHIVFLSNCWILTHYQVFHAFSSGELYQSCNCIHVCIRRPAYISTNDKFWGHNGLCLIKQISDLIFCPSWREGKAVLRTEYMYRVYLFHLISYSLKESQGCVFAIISDCL